MNALPITLLLNVAHQVAVMALVVLGLGIVFGMLRVMNMAHGEFVMLGAYAMVAVQKAGLPLASGLPLAVALTAALGWAIERWLIRPLRERPFDTLVVTWGLAMLLRKAVEAVFGRGYQSIEHELTGTVEVFGAPYPSYRLVLIGGIAVSFAVLGLWYRRSLAGARLKAMVANPTLAEACGLDTRQMASAAFVIGVATAGAAGALLAPLVRVDPSMGLDYLLNSFFVLVVGGVGSLAGLAVGTGLIGGVQVIAASLLNQVAANVIVLLGAIVFLWAKPNGLVARG
jgi:branched-subunit amino acid ABC-type transport system permease component